MPSADMPFIPAVDDRWAILSEPPGTRDLLQPDHWARSLERSRRRREARRSRLAGGAGPRVGVALATLAAGGTVGALAGAVPATAQSTSLELERGDRGAAVRALQRRLGISADGVFGPQTERAVKRFQRRNGLPPVGRVGPRTTAALGLSTAAPVQRRGTRRRVRRADGPPAVRLSPAAARAMQSALGVSADGIVGPQTRRALRRYERSQGLPADGRPDADVLARLGIGRAGAGAPSEEDTSEGAPAAAKGVRAAVEAARAQIGKPYRSAGDGPGGFDCSGLTVFAFRKAGISLPRTSYAQYERGTRIPRRAIAAGDLVFFDTAGAGASHVGVATGSGTVISATTRGVMEHEISTGYWGSHYVGARRLT